MWEGHAVEPKHHFERRGAAKLTETDASNTPPISGHLAADCLDVHYPYLPEDSLTIDFMLAQSINGVGVVDGRSGALSSPLDFQLLNHLRSQADAILVGANTARDENYFGARTTARSERLRAGRGQATVPPIIVVSRAMDFDTTQQLFWNTSTPPIFVTSTSAPPERLARVRAAGGHVLTVASANPSGPDVCQTLAEAGFRQVVCEGGSQLFRLLAPMPAVRHINLTIAPQWVPPRGHPDLGDPGTMPVDFHLGQVLTSDTGHVFTRWDRPQGQVTDHNQSHRRSTHQ